MKKLILTAVSASALLALSACGNNDADTAADTTVVDTAAVDTAAVDTTAADSAVAAADTAAAAADTAAAAAGLAWMFFDVLKGKKPSVLGFCIGAVVGLVAITPAAGFVAAAHWSFSKGANALWLLLRSAKFACWSPSRAWTGTTGAPRSSPAPCATRAWK